MHVDFRHSWHVKVFSGLSNIKLLSVSTTLANSLRCSKGLPYSPSPCLDHRLLQQALLAVVFKTVLNELYSHLKF